MSLFSDLKDAPIVMSPSEVITKAGKKKAKSFFMAIYQAYKIVKEVAIGWVVYYFLLEGLQFIKHLF